MFMTFSHGPRGCIGRRFAEIELKAILIALIGRFEFDLISPDYQIKTVQVITARPVDGLPLRIKEIS